MIKTSTWKEILDSTRKSNRNDEWL